MGKLKETRLEEHPVTHTFRVMFDELAISCQEILEIRERLGRTARDSEEFYRLMARLDTLLMAIGLTAKRLRSESERMDEMFDHEWRHSFVFKIRGSCNPLMREPVRGERI